MCLGSCLSWSLLCVRILGVGNLQSITASDLVGFQHRNHQFQQHLFLFCWLGPLALAGFSINWQVLLASVLHSTCQGGKGGMRSAALWAVHQSALSGHFPSWFKMKPGGSLRFTPKGCVFNACKSAIHPQGLGRVCAGVYSNTWVQPFPCIPRELWSKSPTYFWKHRKAKRPEQETTRRPLRLGQLGLAGTLPDSASLASVEICSSGGGGGGRQKHTGQSWNLCLRVLFLKSLLINCILYCL